MSDSEFVFVYSTFPDEAAARRVGEALVTQRLAACVNIYPPMHSIYEWQGKLESAPEVAAFIKTRRTKARRHREHRQRLAVGTQSVAGQHPPDHQPEKYCGQDKIAVVDNRGYLGVRFLEIFRYQGRCKG